MDLGLHEVELFGALLGASPDGLMPDLWTVNMCTTVCHTYIVYQYCAPNVAFVSLCKTTRHKVWPRYNITPITDFCPVFRYCSFIYYQPHVLRNPNNTVSISATMIGATTRRLAFQSLHRCHVWSPVTTIVHNCFSTHQKSKRIDGICVNPESIGS
jgi:hypothetical protein